MQKLQARSLATAVLLLSGAALADFNIAVINEGALPYAFSPNNYANSSANYSNSISNYANSSANYKNSPANYNNSPANYANGRSGSHRLIWKDGGTRTFAGYYVASDTGVINFFSPKGKRLFYNPTKGQAVFGMDGSFCGVVASVSNEPTLALTSDCAKILLLAD